MLCTLLPLCHSISRSALRWQQSLSFKALTHINILTSLFTPNPHRLRPHDADSAKSTL